MNTFHYCMIHKFITSKPIQIHVHYLLESAPLVPFLISYLSHPGASLRRLLREVPPPSVPSPSLFSLNKLPERRLDLQPIVCCQIIAYLVSSTILRQPIVFKFADRYSSLTLQKMISLNVTLKVGYRLFIS